MLIINFVKLKQNCVIINEVLENKKCFIKIFIRYIITNKNNEDKFSEGPY